MQGAQQGKAEALGRLRPHQVVARHGVDDHAVPATLERVGHRNAGDGAVKAIECCEHAPDQAGRNKGAGAVMHQHELRTLLGRKGVQRLQAGTDAVLARGTARHRPTQDGSARIEAVQRHVQQNGVAHRLQKRHMRQQGFGSVADHGAAAELDELLGRGAAVTTSGSGGQEKGGDAHRRSNAARPGFGQHRRKFAAVVPDPIASAERSA